MAKIRIPFDFKQKTSRAKHDLSHAVRTTLHTGLVTPVYFRRLYAGDDISLQIDVYKLMTQSTVFPVLGNFRVRHEIVFQPDSNLYGWLNNNDKKDTDFFLNQARKNQFKVGRYLQLLEIGNEVIDFLKVISENLSTGNTSVGTVTYNLGFIDTKAVLGQYSCTGVDDVNFRNPFTDYEPETYNGVFCELGSGSYEYVGSPFIDLNTPGGSDLLELTIPQVLRAGSVQSFLKSAGSEAIDRYFFENPRVGANIYGVRPGSLFDYIGIPSGWINTKYEFQLGQAAAVVDNPSFCLDYILTYMDYWRSYHRNNQEENIPFISQIVNNPYVNSTDDIFANFGDYYNGTGTLTVGDAELMDQLFRSLKSTSNGVVLDLNNHTVSYPLYFDAPLIDPVSYYTNNKSVKAYSALAYYLNQCHKPSGGLFPSTYMPDLWRNILNDESSSMRSEVSVVDGKFSIEEFRYKNRLQQIIDRFDISGGRFSNWLKTIWGVKPTKRLDIPQLIGTLTDYIGTTTVTSMADTGKDGASLGQMGAKIDQTRGSKNTHRIKVHENGILMVVVSIVPEVDYFQNLEPYLRDTEFIDEFIPQMARKGFEKLPMSDYVALPVRDGANGYYSPTLQDEVVGKQVAWLREMTAVNRLHGEFSTYGKYQPWVLGRDYIRESTDLAKDYQLIQVITGGTANDVEEGVNSENFVTNYQSVASIPKVQEIIDISTYVNPLDWQYIFQLTDIGSPNWYYQAHFDVSAIRPIGRRFMPTLE